ncbi:MAG: hypothetical protein GXO89_01090 [Chlorobi bacterium]|nr:hypothetical protein [Chlorobiota bacterium]
MNLEHPILLKGTYVPLFFLIIAVTFGSTSCSSIVQGIYGVKNPKELDDRTIIRYSEKYNIPIQDNYKLDTSYLGYLASFDTAIFKEQLKNHFQPLQALYYDKTGQLESFQINCYTGGFPNLKWDRDSILTVFPPLGQAPVDNIVPLGVQLEYLLAFPHTNSFLVENFDYVVVVYWNRYMGRQSRRLIDFVQKNQKLSGDKKVKVIYVNTDGVFAKAMSE